MKCSEALRAPRANKLGLLQMLVFVARCPVAPLLMLCVLCFVLCALGFGFGFLGVGGGQCCFRRLHRTVELSKYRISNITWRSPSETYKHAYMHDMYTTQSIFASAHNNPPDNMPHDVSPTPALPSIHIGKVRTPRSETRKVELRGLW